MKTYELIAPCHFGLEAVLKKEILDLGYEISQVEDGRVTFIGDDEAVCRANIFLRTAERVLLKAGCFKAETFEELFQGTRAIPWEEYIPEDGKFWVASLGYGNRSRVQHRDGPAGPGVHPLCLQQMGVSMDQYIARLHGRQVILVIYMAMGCIQCPAVYDKQSVIRHDREVKHHLVHLRVTVSPDRADFILHGV